MNFLKKIEAALGGDAFARRFMILFGGMFILRLVIMCIPELTPQECYYWNYSRHLALGYFDHPPVTAWFMRIFCGIFGTNAFGVRFVAFVAGLATMLLMYLLGKRLWNTAAGFLGALFLAATPLGAIGGWFVTPDPALIFFWTASVWFFHLAITDEKPKYYLLTGLCAGLAMLSKYPAVFLYAGFAVVLFADSRGRRALLTPWPYLALLISVVAFSPEIIWNAQNGWASFAFQSTRRAHEVRHFRPDLFLGYLASQALVVTPLLYYAIVRGGIASIKKAFAGDFKLLFLSAFCLPMLFFFSFVGLFYWIKINWLAPSYITGALLFAGLATEGGKVTKYAKIAVWSSAVLTFLLYVELIFAPVPVTGEMMTVAGNKQLAEYVENQRQFLPDADRSFVFGWEYKTPSILAFYLPDRPETYADDVLGSPYLQYRFWFDAEKLRGRNAIFVVDDRHKMNNLQLLYIYFRKWEKVEDFSPEFRGKKITTYHIYRCYGYNPPR